MTQQGPLNILNPGTAVTSITGTAPITANGVSGVSETGDVTIALTTPLSIGFGGTGLPTIPTNGQLLIGNGTNYTLGALTAGSGISITNGVGSISIAVNGSGVVTSLTATAPITVSASTGAVNIALTTPLAGQYGGTGIANTGLTINLASGATGKYLGSDSSGNATWQTLSSTAVTSITGTANQVLVNGTTGSPVTGAITLTLPQSIATTSNVQFGSLGLGVAASGTTGRFQCTGDTKFGSSASLSTIASHEFVWVSEVGSFITIYFTGTMTNVSAGGAQAAIEIQTVFNASSGAWASADGIFSNPTYNLGANLTGGSVFRSAPTLTQSSGLTLGSLYGFRAGVASAGGFTGTLTNNYGFYAEALNVGTNRYGGYFLNPASGTIAIACYADNLSVGYNVSPPTNGMIISGSVAIGSSSATASAILALTSTTQGFLPVVMSNTQRNAISSPATGLTIYNSTTLDLETYNGTIWVGASGSGVTSITGTANQISTSSSTGAVTLSLTNGISIGSYQGTSSPTGGLIFPGKLGIGTSSPNASDYITISPSFSSSGGAAYVQRLTGITLTATATNDEFDMIRLGAPVLATTAGSFTGLTFYGLRFFSPTKTGNGTFSTAYGINTAAIASIATNQYGGYFNVPTGGTVNTALYGDNLAIGYTTPTPPSNGAIISGAMGIGTSGPVNKLDVAGGVAIGSYAGVNTAPSNGLIVSGEALFKSTSAFINAAVEVGGSDRIGLGIGGTRTATDGGVQASIFLLPTFSPVSDTPVVSGYQSYPTFSPPTGVTIATAYNIYLQSGGQAGLGTVTNGISLYVSNPGFGTNKIALYSDNVSINYSTATTTEVLSVQGLSGGGIANFYNATANSGLVAFQTSNSSALNPSALIFRHTRGTLASPTATQSGDILGAIDFGGYTNALYNSGIAILATATETWSATAAGSKIEFYVTNNTTVSNSLALTLSSQGSVVCGGSNGAAIATNATDGFVYIPSCNGTPTGTPTTFTGRNAMVYDTSANKIWIYNGSWRGVVVT